MTLSIPVGARSGVIATLRAAGCVFAEDEAAALIAAAGDDRDTLAGMVSRRTAGEPLEQVVGYADFCGVRIRLRPGVFVPRVRSALLVRLAVEAARQAAAHPETAPPKTARPETTPPETGRRGAGQREAGRREAATVVDLCCGSGALGAAVAHRLPGVVLYAADVSPAAVACALDNLDGAPVYEGDLFAALPGALRGRVDVLLANVPYVPTRHLPLLPPEARLHEPAVALDGGVDGLDVFRAVVTDAPGWLAPGGVLLSEVTEAQVEPALSAMRSAGLLAAAVEDDDLESWAVTGRRRRGPEPRDEDARGTRETSHARNRETN